MSKRRKDNVIKLYCTKKDMRARRKIISDNLNFS